MKTMSIAMAAVLTMAAAPGPQARPPLVIGTIAQWFGADSYPAEAMRVGEQGRVRARVLVDGAGKPTGCTVTLSSGSYNLDSGTCEIAMAHLVFTPATDAAGQAVAGVFPFSIVWQIPREPSAAPLPVTFAGKGEAVTCAARMGGASRRLKPETCRSLATTIVAGGGRIDRVNTVPVPPDAFANEAPR